jgi:hypothetical protein
MRALAPDLLAIGVAAVVVLNTARIDAMAVSESQYIFWHEGLVMLSAVLGLFYFGLRPTSEAHGKMSGVEPDRYREATEAVES